MEAGPPSAVNGGSEDWSIVCAVLQTANANHLGNSGGRRWKFVIFVGHFARKMTHVDLQRNLTHFAA